MKNYRAAVLLFSILLCGCDPSGDVDIVTSVTPTGITKLQTTAIPLALDPTKISTSEPTGTTSPLPTSTPSIDLSQISLKQQDLKNDFYAIPSALVGLSEADIQTWYSETDIEVVNAFFFTDELEERYIVGWTILLPERLEGTGFDIVMRHHEYVLVNAVAGLGGEEILQRDTLPLYEDIGNDALGLRLLVKEQGESYQFWVDAILFQRDFVGVTVFEAYEDWMEPFIGIESIANILDKKILEVLRP